MTEPLLRLDDLHAGYGNREVLRAVSLEVYPGEIVGVIGGNGSGKSTLLKVIAGLLRQRTGAVWFRGGEISGLQPHERRRLGIGYLMQNAPLFETLTVAEHAHMFGLDAASNHVARHWADRGGTPAQRVGNLSGGERHLLAALLWIANPPALLLLDEPFSGVADSHARELSERILETAHQDGTAVMLVEHQAEHHARLASRAVPIDRFAETNNYLLRCIRKEPVP